jgi:hypothetical protein
MKLRNCIFIYIMAFMLFSCVKKNNEIVQQETEKFNVEKSIIEAEENKNNNLNKSYALDDEMKELIRSKVNATEEEKEAMKIFLYKNDKNIKDYNRKIVYIEKANFGIKGGDNWVVRLDNRIIYFYAISGNKIERNKYGTSFNLEENSDFNIMQDIPGTRIDNSTSSFGDFNGDGKDELFVYGFYGYGAVIIIWGYDEEKDDFVSFCEIPFDILDFNNGPAPVEFMIFQGMFGFKVYYFSRSVAGGSGYVSESDMKNGTWRFYTWDTEQRKYIEIGEVIE